jgi:signal transduction histidine kinase
MRNSLREGGDPEPEIDAVQLALRDEQNHVRSLIAKLRQGSDGKHAMDVASVFRVLLRGLESHWNVTIRLHSEIEPMAMTSWMAHEMDGILREAISNAVRHGGASEIAVEVGGTAERLSIAIADNGRGFSEGANASAPRSISDRVIRLRGTFALTPVPKGARLQIALPLGEVR